MTGRVGIFVRILLWFITTVFLVTGVTAAMIWYLHDQAADGQLERDLEFLLSEAREIVIHIENGNSAGISSGMPIWIADLAGNIVWQPLSFRRMLERRYPLPGVSKSWEPDPFLASATAEFLRSSQPAAVFKSQEDEFLVTLVVSPGGIPYVGFLKFRPSPLNMARHLLITPDLLGRLTILGCLAVLLCWLLARSLAGPVLEMRRKSSSIAAGDFRARLPGRLTGRSDELGDLARDFNLMAETIERSFTNQKQLLRDVSHELRTPLTRIQLALELIRKAPADAEKLTANIERDLGRLNELIQQVLDLSRMDIDNGASLVFERRDLAGLVREIAADVAFEAELHRKTISLALPAGAVEVPMAVELVRRAVENVLRNAVRYTPEETEIRVGISVDPTEGAVDVMICDHGRGVSEEHLPRLFDPFFRCETDRGRQSGGNGLGLAIVKRAIEVHGGVTSARNAEGGGLEIILRLPMK